LAFVNAHGTATPFNDEMEAVALSRSGLESVPVNSFKAYVGHTLGAAGLVETILSAHSLSQRKHIQSLGYETRGVSTNMHVVVTPSEIDKDECLKTASGFGGCNAVVHLKHYR
jgi:3-oxoacyl-[acyl-carrier-protein] synthase-1